MTCRDERAEDRKTQRIYNTIFVVMFIIAMGTDWMMNQTITTLDETIQLLQTTQCMKGTLCQK
jgi:hypothetical protein